jgi:hypothetical protein
MSLSFSLYNPLLFGIRSMAEAMRELPWSREVCYHDPSKIWDAGLQVHDHSHGDEPKEAERL